MNTPNSPGEDVMAEAAAIAGLEDFGPGDFREGLQVLLESIEADAELSPAAHVQVMGDVRRRLVNRLQVEAWYADHPQIADQPIRGPIDINGLPRTGTTALANMMSLDPQFRSLRGWEQAQPVPPPTPETEPTDPRRLQAEAEEALIPAELKAMHLYDMNATFEDTEVLGMAFHGQQYTLPVYRYHAWWRAADMTDTYRYHRRITMLLQSQRPPNLWLFKAPHHKFHLEAILTGYPDARFVMTHRDPTKSVPSYASLVSAIFPKAAQPRDPHKIGREVSNHLREGMENAIAARKRIGEDRFFDVHHHELNADPMGTMQRVYDWLGLELTGDVQAAMQRWQQTNRSGAHGDHRYTPEQFGLSRAQLRSDYDFYIRHFDIPVKDWNTMAPLPDWKAQMRALENVGDNLMSVWRPDDPTADEVQDMNRLALSQLASGYFCRVYTDASRPVFMPLWNYASNQGGPNPDYVYSTTEVDVDGVYEISGFRGTTRFVEITQQCYDMLSTDYVDQAAPVASTHDLDDLQLGDHGEFRVILSAERPVDHEGDWWPLDHRTRRLLMRKCSCDWRNEVDARVAINRLDDPGADMTPEETARRFADLAEWVEGTIGFDMKLARYYREHHGVNTFLRSQKIASIGGLPTQAYYDGIHEITDDEALILETRIPETIRYWQALVGDDRFCTIDWMNRQSSLNDHQAHIDSDGKFRAVISRLDPGVPNWLDKADYPWGMIQLRWNRANEYPDPTMIKVPFAEIRNHLPADTPVVTPAGRAAQLRTRREDAQLRRIW